MRRYIFLALMLLLVGCGSQMTIDMSMNIQNAYSDCDELAEEYDTIIERGQEIQFDNYDRMCAREYPGYIYSGWKCSEYLDERNKTRLKFQITCAKDSTAEPESRPSYRR
ncbi:hypothetical protein ACFL1B_00510 [Nanoarchaeota archaeon]